MQRRREWNEALSSQSLLLHAHYAPSRMTTRTVIESVKSTWTRNDSPSPDSFGSDSRSKLVGRTPYLIADPDY